MTRAILLRKMNPRGKPVAGTAVKLDLGKRLAERCV